MGKKKKIFDDIFLPILSFIFVQRTKDKAYNGVFLAYVIFLQEI